MGGQIIQKCQIRDLKRESNNKKSDLKGTLLEIDIHKDR